MTAAEKHYHELSEKIPETIKGKMFGALCLKAANGKAFVMFWKDFMLFKLEKENLENALKIKDAKIFDPMGGRPMNGWVQISYAQKKNWEALLYEAYDYVKLLKGK